MRDDNEEALIEVRDLSVGHDGETLLKGLNFQVGHGEVFGILGGSGFGKSTVLRTMLGLLPPISGKVLVGGQDMHAGRREERDILLRKVGVLFQEDALFGSMSLAENVAFPLEHHTALDARTRDRLARLKLRLLGLEGSEDRRPAEVSGGMRKSAAVARAMALDPKILFMDEPTAGFDPALAAQMDALIARFARVLGTTFVLVTHDLGTIFSVVDRALLIDKEAGRALALGTPEEIRDSEDPAVRRFFRRVPDEDLRRNRGERAA